MYDELKSSLGESEADVQIKLFMVRLFTYVSSMIFIVDMCIERTIQTTYARDRQAV